MQMSVNVTFWSKHFDIRSLAPIFYLKLCNYIYIYIYTCIAKSLINKKGILLQPCSWCRGGVENEQFQQSASTHSGAGKRDALNINVVGKANSLSGHAMQFQSNLQYTFSHVLSFKLRPRTGGATSRTNSSDSAAGRCSILPPFLIEAASLQNT